MKLDKIKFQLNRVTSRISGRVGQLLAAPNPNLPPDAERMVGEGDFDQIGNEFKTHFIELAGLQPSHSILDVGSGVGRMALPLTPYINEAGAYHGIDIVKKGVDWCSRHISNRFSNFHFQHIDVINGNYNKKGKVRAEDFVFPFGDSCFDRVVLVSVFTHMLEDEVRNYLKEIARVLKPGGRCLCTAFLLNEESRRMISLGMSSQNFHTKDQTTAIVYDKNPEAAIAFDEQRFIQIMSESGLKIFPPVHYGSWSGRADYLSYQDSLIMAKVDSSCNL